MDILLLMQGAKGAIGFPGEKGDIGPQVMLKVHNHYCVNYPLMNGHVWFNL